MRGKQAPKRKIKPDAKYSNTIVAKFINYIMNDGKKNLAQRIVYKSFDILEEAIKKGRINKDKHKTSVVVFEAAIKTVMPQLEIRGRRIGGANYQIPYQVKGDRRYALAFRWIIEAAKKRKGRSMSEKLAEEFISILEGTGDAMKKRSDVQRMAEANRAFAHFAR